MRVATALLATVLALLTGASAGLGCTDRTTDPLLSACTKAWTAADSRTIATACRDAATAYQKCAARDSDDDPVGDQLQAARLWGLSGAGSLALNHKADAVQAFANSQSMSRRLMGSGFPTNVRQAAAQLNQQATRSLASAQQP
jgi:hypothetical protein